MEDLEEMEERELVERAKEEDPEAFGVLYKRYVRKIYRYIWYRIGNHQDTEDLTAKVFYKALANIDRYEQRGKPFSAWLYRIAHNLVANWFRDRERRRKRKEIFLGWLPRTTQPEDGPEAQVEIKEGEKARREAFLEIIRRRPPNEQQLLILKFVEGMSNAKIGRIVGCSEGAVKSRYFRILKSLKEEFGTN